MRRASYGSLALILAPANGFAAEATATDWKGIVQALFWSTIVLCAYFLPAIIAHRRNTSNKDGLTILNLLLGWTALGWLVILVMACGSANNVEERDQSELDSSTQSDDRIYAEGVISGTPYWRSDRGEYCAQIRGVDFAFPSVAMLKAALSGETFEDDAEYVGN